MKILQKEEILPILKDLFASAKEKVKISSPWIKSEVFEKLFDEKNLDVELIIRNSELEDFLITDLHILKKIKDINGKVYLNPDLHAKFVIVDDKKAIVGSANITRSGLYQDGNIETAVLIEDKKEIKELIDYFDRIKENSLNIFSDISGIVLNSLNSITAEVLLFEDIPEQTYIKIPLSENAFLNLFRPKKILLLKMTF